MIQGIETELRDSGYNILMCDSNLDINREIMSDEREQEYPVLDEILKLPQKYREVLYLYYYEEYSVKEIGIMLKRKESTIQSRLAAGRNKLKTRLADRKGVW